MHTRRALALGVLVAGFLYAQDSAPSVQVTDAVKQALTLTAEDLAKMPRATVRTMNNGMETVYEGVWLHKVLNKAGVPQGSELRGKALVSARRISLSINAGSNSPSENTTWYPSCASART